MPHILNIPFLIVVAVAVFVSEGSLSRQVPLVPVTTTSTTPHYTPSVEFYQDVKDVGKVKDLGNGFESRTLTFTDGSVITQIHFPKEFHSSNPKFTRELYELAVLAGLVSEFGCDKFKECVPELIMHDDQVLTKIDSKIVRLALLRESREDHTIVSVIVLPSEVGSL